MSSAAVELSDERRHLDDLKSVQGQLMLSNIMTPRHEFLCCSASETVCDVLERVSDVFDAIPVTAVPDTSHAVAPIIGLLHRGRVSMDDHGRLAGDCVDWSAVAYAHPSDRNLLVYVTRLSGHPVELVQNGGEIVGLVTPYDLERLPVRTALFAQIIDVERLIGDLIRVRFPDTSKWETLVAPSLRSELRKGLDRARGPRSSGHAILAVGFSVKLDLLCHCFDREEQKAFISKERHEIRTFRNNVAHGAPFPDVLELPGQVRHLVYLRSHILNRIAELSGRD